ncbi:MAG: serine hydrolase [Bacteroidia bacterium]
MFTDKNKIIVIPFLLLAGAVIGFFMRGFFDKMFDAAIRPPQFIFEISQTKEVRAGGYEFINPLLECVNFNPIRGGALITLEGELKAYIEQALKNNKAQHVSVYFRDLNNGPWVGIDEDEKYSPASLLKVPVAIAAMKRAEVDPYFLQKTVEFQNALSTDALPDKNDTVYINKGKLYKIAELVEYMVAGSDNEAMMLVLKNTGEGLTGKVMADLGIKKSDSDDKNDFVSVREYSSMFRLLFNATYLSKEKSNQLLGMMSKSKYTDGLVAGVPASVKVAHKFGERAFDNTTTRQLHDCGIVYLPQSPYLLCVMTRGDDFNELKTIVSDISAIVYTKVSEVSPPQN